MLLVDMVEDIHFQVRELPWNKEIELDKEMELDKKRELDKKKEWYKEREPDKDPCQCKKKELK